MASFLGVLLRERETVGRGPFEIVLKLHDDRLLFEEKDEEVARSLMTYSRENDD